MVLRPPGDLPIASVTMATTHGLPLPSDQQGRTRTLTVLLYSDDSSTREKVRMAVGRRPASDLPAVEWIECATEAAVVAAADAGRADVLVLDGEAVPYGGMGVCRQLKNEIYDCPPILVLTGRREDAWLASWSQADLAVPHPLDPAAVAQAVAELARRRLG
jgi:DNA-binding response OmpR family regulator